MTTEQSWKLAFIRSTVAYGVDEAKIVIKEIFPGIIPLVTIGRLVRDTALSGLGSRGAKERVGFIVACAFADPPKFPTGDELKVVTMLARKR